MRWSGGGSHVCPDLGWGLLDNNTPRRLGVEFGSEHLMGWWRSVRGTVVFYKFIWKEEEVEDEPEELGHVSRVAVAARFDLRRG